MATTWGNWPVLLGMDQVATNYPWLNGNGFNVAVIDKGIDYWHPQLGGNRSLNTKSTRIVNVYDYYDDDTDPFPNTSEDVDPTTAHATGVAGILAALPYDLTKNGNTRHYQGMLQNAQIYNIRTDRFDSQNTIKLALQWVLDHHAEYNITAINLTDFVGTGAATPVYATQVQALWNAGVFIATPVANDWQGDNTKTPAVPKWQPIGYPAKSPYVYGTGGLVGTYSGGTITGAVIRPQTQRGQHLDLLGPAEKVTIPYYTAKTNKDELLDEVASGNSWGTPHVVGTAVMLQQIDPTITPAQVMQILQDSGVFVSDPDAAASGFSGYKRLNVLGAVQMAYNVRDDIYDQGKGGDDDLAHAGRITLDGNGAGSVSGLKLLLHDDDYFKFTVGSPQNYDVRINYGGASAYPIGELLDANGNVVSTIPQGGRTGVLPAGDYYVHLYNPTKSLNGTYSITVNADEPAPPPPDPNGYAGEKGTYNQILFDSSDNLHFTWYDAQNRVLKYAKRDTSKVWGATQVIDNAPAVGSFVSMALDGAGRPGVAYYDATNADLKYAKFNGSSWSVQTVDAKKTTGYYPSLKFDKKGNALVAYYYKTGADLRLATNAGGAWSVTPIDTTGDVGRFPSLAANPGTGRWGIAYESTATGAFKFAQQGKSGAWSSVVVDSNGVGGGSLSLAYDGNNQPAFSYYDGKNADLRLARFNGKWSTALIAGKNTVGLYNNLFFDAGNPVIYYYSKTAGALLDTRWNGTAWEYETVVVGGGRENHVALNSGDFETFSYYDDTSGDIKIGDFF